MCPLLDARYSEQRPVAQQRKTAAGLDPMTEPLLFAPPADVGTVGVAEGDRHRAALGRVLRRGVAERRLLVDHMAGARPSYSIVGSWGEMKLREWFSRLQASNDDLPEQRWWLERQGASNEVDVPGGPRLDEEWLEALTSAGVPDAGEVAARWRGTDRLSQSEIARYANWHRLRLHAVFEAAQTKASPADLERVRAEGAMRADEFETHLRWIRKHRMK